MRGGVDGYCRVALFDFILISAIVFLEFLPHYDIMCVHLGRLFFMNFMFG